MWRVLKKKRRTTRRWEAESRGGARARCAYRSRFRGHLWQTCSQPTGFRHFPMATASAHFVQKKQNKTKINAPNLHIAKLKKKEKKMTSRDFEKTHLDWQSNFRQSEETMSRPRLLHLRHGCHHSKNCAPKNFETSAHRADQGRSTLWSRCRQ